jgi:hypothetical protein
MRQDLFGAFVTSGKPCGLGLGLTIAEYVAHAYGGSLELESTRPGCTIFALRLAKAVLAVLEPASRPRSITKATNERSLALEARQRLRWRRWIAAAPANRPRPGV